MLGKILRQLDHRCHICHLSDYASNNLSPSLFSLRLQNSCFFLGIFRLHSQKTFPPFSLHFLLSVLFFKETEEDGE